MGKRIFESHNYNVRGKVVPFEDFQINFEKGEKLAINKEHIPQILKNAEEVMTKEFPVLPASAYMMFQRDGNRMIYEGPCHDRRACAIVLALAEYVERKGRFTDKLIDLVWMILEETTWVVPAHNQSHAGETPYLPYSIPGRDVEWIDLFSASTGSILATIYFLCNDIFDEVTPLINERIQYELERRIVKPFLDPVIVRKNLWWTGINGNSLNNWNPWILSNIMTVCALGERDINKREAILANVMPYLDNFIANYKSDGGCEEGPGYWSAAGGALFKAAIIIYDITHGYVNIFNDELFRKMGEYEVKVYVDGCRFLNFADGNSRITPQSMMLYKWGELSGSEMMRTFGLYKLNGTLIDPRPEKWGPYHVLRFLCEPRTPKTEFIAPTKVWLDGIVIAATRESTKTNKGLYLAMKGGYNDESHNHNDLGTLIVFADGQPILLDAGSGTYTRLTFGSDRYTIWSMTSDYHNVANVNGYQQPHGKQYLTENHIYDEKTGKLTLSLKKAYPKEADIKEYTRSSVLTNGIITVEDNITFGTEGNITFHYLCNCKPVNVTDTSFEIHGRTLTFDNSLEYICEPIDASQPETCTIPKGWETDTLYRVSLKSKGKFTTHKFVMTIK